MLERSFLYLTPFLQEFLVPVKAFGRKLASLSALILAAVSFS